MRWIKWIFMALAAILVVEAGKYIYFKPKYDGGEAAPDFEVTLIDGENFKLSQLKGQYVLLDFWGSWCGPCRKENPKLVSLHQSFEGRSFEDANGFDIVSIGMEMKETSWKKAIKRDGLYWKYHHSDFKRMKSEVGQLYKVRQIPTKFLIDPDGMIIKVNPSTEEVFEYLRPKLKDLTLGFKD